ncbi:MAG: hypothetical protein H6686_10415 [Fibrobacteria bacterium]|nr:hypothetical protein [Fibrobacteria bacterium]
MKTNATIALFGMALPLVAGAQESVSQRQEGIEKTLEGILSKAGVSMSGRATGEFAQSTMDGSLKRDSVRATEPVTYTQVDFDMRARPNSVTTARAVFRLHLDWPNFFGAPYTPFETRWLSIDGKAMDMLYYSVGDMSVKWSPYTIYGNDVGFLYTPRMFAQMQEQAMAERFQGNNVRNLQGAQFGLRAAAPPAKIDSFNVGFLATKLTNAINTGDNPPTALPYIFSDFDRWVMGGRGDVTFLGGISLGGSMLAFQDLKGTYADQTSLETELQTGGSRAGSAAEKRNAAQSGMVSGGRFNLQLDRVMQSLPIQVGLNTEFSMSSWETQGMLLNTNPRILGADTKGLPEIPDSMLSRKKTDGVAFAADLVLGYSMEKVFGGSLSAGFMMNDSGYRNDLVQAQSFVPNRIYNSVQGSDMGMYSTFDAMYHNVHRFVPEIVSNEMVKNPFEKVGYSNQIGANSTRIDPVLQTVLPGGAATANRVGPRFGLDVGMLDGALTLVSNGWILSTAKDVPVSTEIWAMDSATGATSQLGDSMVYAPVRSGGVTDTIMYNLPVAQKIDYQKIQAGLKLRADKFLGDAWKMPLELMGSYELNSAKSGSAVDYKANILNAGLYVGVWKRIALTGGYQMINTEKAVLNTTKGAAGQTPYVSGKYTSKQTNVGGGLEYTITEGSYASFTWHKVSVEYPEDKFVKKADQPAVARDFSQNILNAKLTVGF